MTNGATETPIPTEIPTEIPEPKAVKVRAKKRKKKKKAQPKKSGPKPGKRKGGQAAVFSDEQAERHVEKGCALPRGELMKYLDAKCIPHSNFYQWKRRFPKAAAIGLRAKLAAEIEALKAGE